MTHAERAERRKRMAEAVAAGERPADVAKRFRAGLCTVIRGCQESGVNYVYPTPNWARAVERRTELAGLYRDGATICDIADLEGVSKQRIQQMLQRAGVSAADRKHRYCSCGERYGFNGHQYRECPECRTAKETCACGRKKRSVKDKCRKCHLAANRLRSDSEIAVRLYEMGYSTGTIWNVLGTGCNVTQAVTRHGGKARRQGNPTIVANRRALARMPIAKAAAMVREQIKQELQALEAAPAESARGAAGAAS